MGSSYLGRGTTSSSSTAGVGQGKRSGPGVTANSMKLPALLSDSSLLLPPTVCNPEKE